MKKCASCTKDLPDAALHCVFCGAKQPPAPAVQQSMAKTAFGYSANDLQDQLRQGSAPRAAQPAPGFPPPRPQPPSFQPMATAPTAVPPPPSSQPMAMAPTMVPPPPRSASPMAMAATQAVPAYQGGPSGPMASPAMAMPQPAQMPPSASGLAPASNAGAATLYVQQPPTAPSGSFGRSAPLQPTIVPAPLQPIVPPLPQAMSPQAMPLPMAIPAAMPQPYQTSPTATNVRRPIDPWRDSLRAMMFIWGVLLLAAFATPVATKPDLAFNWKPILDGAGLAMLPPLMIAAVGLLSVVLAFVPMPTAARGVLATLLGLAGIAVPIVLADHLPVWQQLAPMAGVLILVPSLIVRSEYLAALVPRLLITIGVLAILVPYLLPVHGAIPLVALFKMLIDVPGTAKVGPALQLGFITLVVLALLAWLPSPATGAAKLWAWLIILWTLITHVTMLVLAGGVVDKVTAAPGPTLTPWIYGGLGAAYVVLVGYGLACVIGKQLE